MPLLPTPEGVAGHNCDRKIENPNWNLSGAEKCLLLQLFSKINKKNNLRVFSLSSQRVPSIATVIWGLSCQLLGPSHTYIAHVREKPHRHARPPYPAFQTKTILLPFVRPQNTLTTTKKRQLHWYLGVTIRLAFLLLLSMHFETTNSGRHRDYSMENACVRFLLTSWVFWYNSTTE